MVKEYLATCTVPRLQKSHARTTLEIDRVLSVIAWFRQLTVPGNRVRARARGCCPLVTSRRSVRCILFQSYS